ncbi:universal stress protein [Piscinibacter sp.]|jgi:nucleotide-binding universal stress UspA family protein|uniref:universal stress protein n=1 Tax=Piscinibacter sp. TaxID=1903157 RepID=UPI002F41836C
MIERLLVPIDGGALDERAFAVSVDLARQLGAAITGFIVEPYATAPAPVGLPSDASTPRTDATLQAHAQRVLARFEQRAREAGVSFDGVATQASEVSEAILAAAEKHRCDMIVMATHGRGVIAELLWGSNTRQVMSRSRLPVLVLH